MKLFWTTLCLSCLGLSACGGGPPTRPTSTPTLSRTRFLAFGDSLTSGEVTAPVGFEPGSGGTLLRTPNFKMVLVPSASYPTQLASMLQARYRTQAGALSITNAGEPGEFSFFGVERFPREVAAANPEVVLLLEGANDLRIFGPGTPAMALQEMMAEGRRLGVRVFVGTPMPSKPGGRNSLSNVVLEELSAMLKVAASAENAVVVDLFGSLLPEVNTIIGADGLHPTEVGYKRIADMFFAAIQANLEVK